MTACSKIDLHMHSAASDGRDQVPELLKKIRAHGIETFALTDHDTVEGCLIMHTLDLHGLRFLDGVEMSCLVDGKSCHILGLGFDPRHPAIEEIIRKQQEARAAKLVIRLEFLKKEFGILLPADALERLHNIKNVGKPHIADEMVRANPEAFPKKDARDFVIREYLNKFKSNAFCMEAGEAITAIRKAGGKAVWAHPLGDKKHIDPAEFERRLKLLLAQGLQGLECYHVTFSPQEIRTAKEAAKKYGLLVSCGSDYHGEDPKNNLGKLGQDFPLPRKEEITVLV